MINTSCCFTCKKNQANKKGAFWKRLVTGLRWIVVEKRREALLYLDDAVLFGYVHYLLLCRNEIATCERWLISCSLRGGVPFHF